MSEAEQIPFGITLPAGLSLEPTEAELRDTVPGFKLYGGATCSRARDAAGKEYIACCANDNATGDFRFHVLEVTNGTSRDVPLQYRCTGRGTLDIDPVDGSLWWIAWEGNSFYRAPVAGSARFSTAGGGGTYSYEPIATADGYVRLFVRNGTGFEGQAEINAVALGIPQNADALNVRLTVSAPQAGARGRVGPSLSTGGMLTVSTQVANTRQYDSGIIPLGSGGMLYVLADAGYLDSIFVDVTGYWV